MKNRIASTALDSVQSGIGKGFDMALSVMEAPFRPLATWEKIKALFTGEKKKAGKPIILKFEDYKKEDSQRRA